MASEGGAMTAGLKQNAATGAPASSWKPYPAYKDSGVEGLGKVPEQGSETANIYQTGLTGSTGCVLLLNPIYPVILSRINELQMNTDERRLIASAHRKGREERKAELHKSVSIYTIIRPGTRMTRIGRISTDNHIRAHPCNPCNPCSIVENLDRNISYLWPLSSIGEQEAAQ